MPRRVLAATETTVPATGALRFSWLLLAFPVFGAAVLLVGGRRTNRWGHLLGVAMPLAAFVYGVIAFFTLLGDSRPQPGPAPVLLDPGGGLPGEHRNLLSTRCRSASCC